MTASRGHSGTLAQAAPLRPLRSRERRPRRAHFHPMAIRFHSTMRSRGVDADSDCSWGAYPVAYLDLTAQPKAVIGAMLEGGPM